MLEDLAPACEDPRTALVKGPRRDALLELGEEPRARVGDRASRLCAALASGLGSRFERPQLL